MNFHEIHKRKAATIYRRKLNFIVHPWTKTADGVWMLAEPISRLDVNATSAEIGLAVQRALDEPGTIVPHPTDFKGVLAPRLKVAGVKS